MSQSTLAILILTATLGLAACEQEGPAERAGEAVDEFAEELRGEPDSPGEKLAETAEQVCEDVADATGSDANC